MYENLTDYHDKIHCYYQNQIFSIPFLKLTSFEKVLVNKIKCGTRYPQTNIWINSPSNKHIVSISRHCTKCDPQLKSNRPQNFSF